MCYVALLHCTAWICPLSLRLFVSISSSRQNSLHLLFLKSVSAFQTVTFKLESPSTLLHQVGWSRANLVKKLRENPSGVTLVLKKIPGSVRRRPPQQVSSTKVSDHLSLSSLTSSLHQLYRPLKGTQGIWYGSIIGPQRMMIINFPLANPWWDALKTNTDFLENCMSRLSSLEAEWIRSIVDTQ